MSERTAATIFFACFGGVLCAAMYADLQGRADDTKRMIACVENGGEWVRPGWGPQYECVNTNEERDSE